MAANKVREAEAALGHRTVASPDPGPCLSAGLTLVNLAISGRPDVALQKGRMYRIAGRASAGKTFLGKTILAEAAASPLFAGYELVFDDAEHGGGGIDTVAFFGKKLHERMVVIHSRGVDDWLAGIEKRLAKRQKFIQVTDSMDVLNPVTLSKMGDGKAKYYSQHLRLLIDVLDATGSILVMVSQAHMDIKSMFGGDVAAGGRALEFYPTFDLWLRKVKTLKKVVKRGGKELRLPVGNLVMARVNKTRQSGGDHIVYVVFDPSYGFDDVGSNIDYLVAAGQWKKDKAGIHPRGVLTSTGSRTQLVARVEATGTQAKLAAYVGTVWQQIQKAIHADRKPKYQ